MRTARDWLPIARRQGAQNGFPRQPALMAAMHHSASGGRRENFGLE
jgi:hypothetical protein